jgi:hypothetical protein
MKHIICFVVAILWALAFFLAGLIVFVVYVFTHIQMPPYPERGTSEVEFRLATAGILSVLATLIFPFVGLILGICGVLPGTRRRGGSRWQLVVPQTDDSALNR